MALTRKLLKSLGLEDAQIDTIIDAHTETVDALKKERDTHKSEADKVDELTRQLNEANDKLYKAGDSAKVQAEFDAYKAGVEKEKTAARKGEALNKLLEKAGVARQAFRDLIRKGYDLDKLELLEDGSAKDADKLVEAIKADYADFVGEVKTEGTPKTDPPTGPSKLYTREEIGKMSPAEINKNWGAVQKSLASFK